MDRIEIHQKVINHFGITLQLKKVVEEIDELMIELDKENKSIAAITSELADVCNMTEQLPIIVNKIQELYRIDTKELVEEQNFKMWRTEKIIKEK